MGLYAVHWNMILALNVTLKCNSNPEEEHLLVMLLLEFVYMHRNGSSTSTIYFSLLPQPFKSGSHDLFPELC